MPRDRSVNVASINPGNAGDCVEIADGHFSWSDAFAKLDKANGNSIL